MLVRILMFFLILWLFAIGAIWFAIRQIKSWFTPIRAGASHRQTGKESTGHAAQGQQQKPLAAHLVKCTQCESYIPAEQAILNNNCYYCDPPCNN